MRTGVAAPAVTHHPPAVIHGHCHPGFESVRDVFAENFVARGEAGGACAAYLHGERVVDLWAGVRDLTTGEPWLEDTMVIIWSATKGLAAMVMALAHSRGWIDYDARVSDYWPEFAQGGKEAITVRLLLAHQAGLFAFDEPVDRATVADPSRLADVMARQRPAWPPGERQAYHALTLGFYEGELIRRVDPQHRTLGQVFQDEIATPLGLDLYVRVPAAIPNSRLARLARPSVWQMITEFPPGFLVAAINPHSHIHRALSVNPGSAVALDDQTIYARDLEVPSGGGVGSARSLARAYGVFAGDGHELRLAPKTLRALAAPAVAARHGFYDECMKGEAKFLLGFMKPSAAVPFGGARSFGAPGAGGAMGFADPDLGLGYGYVTSQMGASLTGDPREIALRDAIYAAAARHAPAPPSP